MHSPETRQFGVMSRRAFVGGSVSLATLATLAACAPNPKFIDPDSAAVRAAEQIRSGTGRVVEINLRPAPGTIDLAGQTAQTWSYGTIPAPTVRMTAGDTLRATVTNGLPAETSVHWHGLALRNDMDGVPPLTQTAIAAGGEFTYDFVAPHPGTYWFHPHVGTQLDRGLYGALIVEDPRESLLYDDEWVVVLDDWLDGVTATPDGVLEELSGGMGMGMDGMVMRDGNMLMGATSTLLGGDAGDVYYPTFLVNGRPPEDPEVFESRPGNRVRIRLINAGGDTAFTVALGGHEMTITHTDGFPVVPTKATSVLVGMGERYDVVVTLGDGVFPLVATAEGKEAAAFALLRTGGGAAPTPMTVLPETYQRVGTAGKLAAAEEVTLPNLPVDRTVRVTLGGGMGRYDWTLNGRRFDASNPLDGAQQVRDGENVELIFENTSMMWHPMHLHGHTYQHSAGGPRKDTSIVLPGQSLRVNFVADNPGQWLMHCHNIYHGEAGMMGVLAYLA